MGRTESARVGVASGVERRNDTICVKPRRVRVAEHDQIGVRLSGEKRERGVGVLVAVNDGDSEVVPLENAIGRKPTSDGRRVVIAVDGVQVAKRFERIKNISSHKIAGMDEFGSGLDRLCRPTGEPWIFMGVSVREHDEHTHGNGAAR